MNESTEQLDGALRIAVVNFLTPLQTTRIIKHDAFEILISAAKELARALKGHEFVSKSLLNELYRSVGILRSEAPYFKDETAVLEKMANQLDLTIALILMNESPEDRIPGVPRII